MTRVCVIIESMPVKSLITYPKTGAIIDSGKSLDIRGHAWAGELEVAKVHYSIEFWINLARMHPEQTDQQTCLAAFQCQYSLP